MRLYRFVYISIGGSRHGISFYHLFIAQRGKNHDDCGQQQGKGIHASGARSKDAVIIEHYRRSQIRQAEHDEQRQGKRALELRFLVLNLFAHYKTPQHRKK
ncbi:hypothetical protein SDC9_212764 [bioreactor metagenome]|uniref:Uncharacterized protein n=1 Tax=bioreactor metagenome TaxID=1076179 RepID=A0A645JMU8_9ZZZZ